MEMENSKETEQMKSDMLANIQTNVLVVKQSKVSFCNKMCDQLLVSIYEALCKSGFLSAEQDSAFDFK